MSDYLPQDVLIDIFTRLPTGALVRLTSVCKSWQSLITSPKFISHHLNRNADDRLLLVRYRTDKLDTDHYSLVLDGNDSFRQLEPLDLPFFPKSVGCSVVGSVNGVICLSNDMEHGYLRDMYLWNPTIRKLVALPEYNVTFQSHGPFMHCLVFPIFPTTPFSNLKMLFFLSGPISSIRSISVAYRPLNMLIMSWQDIAAHT